jgi:hypothetical protein
VHRQIYVREAIAAVQRCEAAAVKAVKAGNAEASAKTSIPRIEMITRSQRKPADRAPTTEAKSKSDSNASAEAEERNISRRPDWTVERISIDRAWPPTPAAIDNHPAAIVVRSPSPGIIRNPSPAPIRFIHPATIAVWRPIRVHIRPPHWAVVGNFRPRAILI